MPWFQHRDGGDAKSGTITFGPGHPRVEIRAEDGVFWAPDEVARHVERADHTRLDHGPERSDPPPVQDTGAKPADASTEGDTQGDEEGAEDASQAPADGDAPTRDEIQAANRNTAWNLAKEADPDDQLGLDYRGEDAASGEEMRAALLKHYGYATEE